MLKNWKIPVCWIMKGTVKVDAKTLAEAIEIAQDRDGVIPIPDNGEFLDGSWEVDCEDEGFIRDFYNDGQQDNDIGHSDVERLRETIKKFLAGTYGIEYVFGPESTVCLFSGEIGENSALRLLVVADMKNLIIKSFAGDILYRKLEFASVDDMIDELEGASIDTLLPAGMKKHPEEWAVWIDAWVKKNRTSSSRY